MCLIFIATQYRFDVIFKIDLYSNRIMYNTQMKSILYYQNFMIVKTHSSFSHNIIVRKKKERVGNEWKAYFDNILLEYEIGFMPIFNKKVFVEREAIYEIYTILLYSSLLCVLKIIIFLCITSFCRSFTTNTKRITFLILISFCRSTQKANSMLGVFLHNDVNQKDERNT